jgi:glucose repression regulatory protein TUP1
VFALTRHSNNIIYVKIKQGSLDRIVRLWDIETGKLIARLEGHKDSVYSVAFSPDGRSLISGSLDKTLKLWDLNLGSTRNSLAKPVCRVTFNGHKDFVLSVAFSADGKQILSGSKDRTVQLWDPQTGKSLMILQGHKNSVISVALSPEGGLFATGSGDCKARLWKISQRPAPVPAVATTAAQQQSAPKLLLQ